MSGITPDEFGPPLTRARESAHRKRAKAARHPKRTREPGGGAKAELPPTAALLLPLMSHRADPPHAVLGVRFGIDTSTVRRTNDRAEKLPAGVFRVPERDVTPEEDEIRALLFDRPERPTQRPVRGQKAYYSGKKRRHTLKAQVVMPAGDRARGTAYLGAGWKPPEGQ